MKKLIVVLLMILGFVLLISIGERGAVGQGKRNLSRLDYSQKRREGWQPTAIPMRGYW